MLEVSPHSPLHFASSDPGLNLATRLSPGLSKHSNHPRLHFQGLPAPGGGSWAALGTPAAGRPSTSSSILLNAAASPPSGSGVGAGAPVDPPTAWGFAPGSSVSAVSRPGTAPETTAASRTGVSSISARPSSSSAFPPHLRVSLPLMPSQRAFLALQEKVG